MTGTIVTLIESLAHLPEDARVAAYNRITQALGKAMADITSDPAIAPQLVAAECIRSNDYNPNKVAAPEMALLEESIRADGVTMSVVVMPDEAGGFTVIDGFHRHTVISRRLKRRWVPCSVITRPLADRMASTVRHNRARGKHQVDLMGSLVRAMMDLGWDDPKIAKAMGMSEEELLRLKQTVGAAKMLASTDYNRSWAWREGEADGRPAHE